MVFSIQKILITFLLKDNYPLKTIFYFTDGGPQHYKNKYNFFNLINHNKDFGIRAEWHFHATAHGKGVCDGIGGNIKRLAARASIQGVEILDAKSLFSFIQKNIVTVKPFYVQKAEYDSSKIFLTDRFSSAKTIPGTHKFHAFLPLENDLQLKVKEISFDSEGTIVPKKLP